MPSASPAASPVLVTGISGYVGSLVAERLLADGHAVRGFARYPERVSVPVPVVSGDAVTGRGLREALAGVRVAYFLIHAMDSTDTVPFTVRERAAAERFAEVAQACGVERIVYLGGLASPDGPRSAHLTSRLEVERVLLAAVPGSVALRASIVIGARSRSFRFLVRLVERLPLLALPAWRDNRTAPIDERDVVSMLARCAGHEAVAGRTLDIGGPDVVSYGELIGRIRELMLLDRPALSLGSLSATPIASRLAAAVAGEEHELIGPLMESLETDLLPRDGQAARLLQVRLHSLDAAIEHALAVWERTQSLAAR